MPRQRTERSRQQILEAAARAITRGGMGSVTIQDIAREAQLTPPTLYAYFRSKAEIVQALLEQLQSEAEQAFETRFPGGMDFAQRLEALLLRQCEFVDRRRDLIALVMQGGMMGSDKELCAANRTAHAQHHAKFAEWMRQESADVKWAASVEDVTLALTGLMHAFFGRWVESGERQSFSAYVPTVVKLFLQGARAQPTQTRKLRVTRPRRK